MERLDPLVEDFDAVRLHRGWLRTVAEQPVQIAAGTEHAIGTRQDHGADRIIAGGDFERFRGKRVAVKGPAPLVGRATRLEGELLGLAGGTGEERVRLRLPGGDEVEIPRSQITGAHLVFEW